MGIGPNETEVTCTVPHFWPAAEAAIVPGLASVRQLLPASELASIVPLPSSGRQLAAGDGERAGGGGHARADRPVGRPAGAGVSGGRDRREVEILAGPHRHREPARRLSAAATSPPLSATPGGVTSCQVADLAGRTNTSQNVGLADIGTIAQLSLAVLSEVASETAGALRRPVELEAAEPADAGRGRG